MHGKLLVRHGKADIQMEPIGVIHSDEVSVCGDNSQVYFGSATDFSDKYTVSNDGILSRRVG